MGAAPMFWKTDFGKIILSFLIAFGIVSLIAIPDIILNCQPKQTAHVEVVDKRIVESGYVSRYRNNTNCYVTFKFPDGSEIEFNVRTRKAYDSMQENDTGVLSYKQRKDRAKFVSFEKDEQ